MKDSREWAVRGLRRNGHLVDTNERHIFVGREGPGLKMWRLIDCLCNFHGFYWIREKRYG